MSVLQIETIFVTNSVDPDETAQSEPSHQNLHCLPFCFDFLTETPFWNNGSDQIQKWTPVQKVGIGTGKKI